MTLGSRTRRWFTVGAILSVAILGGCHAMPVARVAPASNRPQSLLASASRAALLPATVALEPPSEMSSIEPVAPNPSTLTRAPSEPRPSSPEPTPLLDAALEKVRAVDEIVASDPARGTPPPFLPPPGPAPNPPSLTFPTFSSPKFETVVEPHPPKPEEARKPEAEPSRPEDLWRDGVRRLVGLARAKLEQPGDPNAAPGTSPWGLRARVLAWLAEPDIDPEIGQRDLDGVRSVLRALDDPPAGSPHRGDEVRSAVLVLEDKAPFEIVDLRVCSKVERFGDFEPIEPPIRKAGQQIILYCEVDGLRFEQSSSGFRTRVSAQLEILPEGGGPAVWTEFLGTVEETCRRRRRDYYIAYLVPIPKLLPPGEYRIRLTEKDLNSDRSASREAAFAIARD